MYTHYIQVYTGIKKYTQVSTPVHMSKHRYTKAYTGINKHYQVFTCLHRYTQAYKCTKRYSRIYTLVYTSKQLYTSLHTFKKFSECVETKQGPHMQLCTFTPAISFALLSSPYTSSLNYMHACKVQVNMHDCAIVCVCA